MVLINLLQYCISYSSKLKGSICKNVMSKFREIIDNSESGSEFPILVARYEKELISEDLFYLNGSNYLVLVDHYSNFIEL